MATLAQIRNNVDTKLAAMWGRVQEWESEFFAAKGRYWQGLANPSIMPMDNLENALDLTRHPHDQIEDWAAANLTVLTTLPMQLAIYAHDGPLGHGYTGIVTVMVLDKIYRRMQGVGSYSMTESWRELIPRP